jgi:hypothetical protein
VSASRAFPLVLLVPVLVAACGSSSSPQTTTAAGPPRLTQKQFVSAGNTVCIDSDRRVAKLGRLTIAPAGWAATAIEARKGLAQMAAVRPPLHAATGFAHLLTLGRQLAAGIEQVHDALVKKDYKAAQAAQLKATEKDTAIHLQAERLGLTFCQQLLTNWPA